MTSVKSMPRQQQKAVFAKMGKGTVSTGSKASRERLMSASLRKVDFPKKSKNAYHATVYVPSTTKRNGKEVQIGRAQHLKRAEETRAFLDKTFGGTTRVRAEGSWIDDKGIVRRDGIFKAETFATKKDYAANDKKLEKWLQKKRKAWNQDSLSYGFESPDRPGEELSFIKKEKKKKSV